MTAPRTLGKKTATKAVGYRIGIDVGGTFTDLVLM